MREEVKVQFTRIHPEIRVPVYAHPGDSGCDIFASEFIDIFPNKVYAVSTGLFFAIPDGYEIQVRSRSGLSLKDITVHNSPGTIDSPYRGECKIIIKNDTPETFKISPGMKIAQLVLQKVPKIIWEEVENLPSSDRGEKGFGSTGV